MSWLLLGVGFAALLLLVTGALERIWPDCKYCAGRGSYLGHSPTASLATFRPTVRLTCLRCGGGGRVRRARRG